jgi:hypothetical protein
MKIEVSNPINVIMDVVDFDDHLPSVQFQVSIKVKRFTYELCTSSCLWFECKVFDDFVQEMQKNECAVLRDIDENFEIIIDPKNDILKWLMKKEDLDGNISLYQGIENLMPDIRPLIYSIFSSYPKWW